MKGSKVFLSLIFLLLLVACSSNDPIILSDEVKFLPIGVMGDLDYQSSLNRLVGTVDSESLTEVYIYDLDAGSFTLVSDSKSSTVSRQPKWNPMDDQMLLFRSDAEFGDRFLIGIVDLSNSQKTAIASGRSPEWLPDGERIAYIADFSHIIIHDVKAAQEEILFSPQLEEGEKIIEIAVSPDGNFLAYSVELANNENQIYIASLANEGYVKDTTLIDQGAYLDYLDWSANSSNIVFQRLSPVGPPEIVAYDLVKMCITNSLGIEGVELMGYSQLEWSLDNSKLFIGGKVANKLGLVIIKIDGNRISNWLDSGECRNK
jgi:Tol biopolymer transport system component